MDAYSARCKEFATNMGLMIKLPSVSRLALAAAFLRPTLVPSAASASSELTPEQMNWYRAQMGLAA